MADNARRQDPESPFVTSRWVGVALPRREDARTVQGQARYVDDIDMETAHVAFVRSPHAHARITAIHTGDAEAAPGVAAVITGRDIEAATNPVAPRGITAAAVQYVMAVHKVRYVGEPVVAVAAATQYLAEDAAGRVRVDYEPLDPVVEIEEALAGNAPLVFEEAGTNVLLHDAFEHGDVAGAFRDADLVVKETFRMPRFSSTPLEPWAVIARYDPGTEAFTVWSNDQQPGRTAINVSRTLRVPMDRIRHIVPDSGGGFGIKLALWPYIVILCLLARRAGRPVRWIQTRSEHLLAGTHTPEAVIDAELALARDGRILAIRLNSKENDGAFVHTAGIYPLIKFAVMVGCYGIRATAFEFSSVVTNKAPTVQNRGVGKPGMIFVLERLVDLAARALALDPAEIRRRNFVQPAQMPYTTPTGEVYESGDYPACLRQALELADYEGWRRKQAAFRKAGRHLGIGVATGIEPGTSNLGYYYISRGRPEFLGNVEGAMVGVDFDGGISVVTGSVDAGQGHATTVAQVVADMLAIRPDQVSMNTHFDSATSPVAPHSGTYANRFNDVEIGAVVAATRKLRAKMLRIAAFVLGVDERSLVFGDGTVHLEGDPTKGVPFAEIAAYAYRKALLLPEDIEPGLREIAYYQNRAAKVPRREEFNIQLTHSNAAHVVVAEVDAETGFVTLLKYVIVHDCGRQLNPGIVKGMVIGSTVHGIGTALYEEFLYSPDGQLLTGTFMDYLKPVALSVPRFDLGEMESLCPTTPLGTKAVGEGGAITSLPAIANAVEDALAPFGVKVTSLPITPEKTLRAIQGAKVI
jgi:2-furoyl-CoA dehydrogenase large subunit